MSYTPDDQLLSGPLDGLIRAMDDVTERMVARLDSGEWSSEHIEELSGLLVELTKLRLRLRKLERSTS